MAKKITGILIIIAFAMGCSLPAVAAEEAKTDKEKPLWVIIADSFKDFKIREQDKIKGVKKIAVFQDMSDSIKSGAKSAKNQSLRGD